MELGQKKLEVGEEVQVQVGEQVVGHYPLREEVGEGMES